jgi:hypothetical protein
MTVAPETKMTLDPRSGHRDNITNDDLRAGVADLSAHLAAPQQEPAKGQPGKRHHESAPEATD